MVLGSLISFSVLLCLRGKQFLSVAAYVGDVQTTSVISNDIAFEHVIVPARTRLLFASNRETHRYEVIDSHRDTDANRGFIKGSSLSR